MLELLYKVSVKICVGGETMLNITKWKRTLILAGKIALGSSLAIYTAEFLHLQFAASAGIVTLLTVVTTKKGTLQLTAARIVTLLISVGIAPLAFLYIQSEWIAYGVYVFLVSFISDALGWRATISTNAVIGTHFLTTRDLSPEFILNECMLVGIGIIFAFILNSIQDIRGEKRNFSESICRLEPKMQSLIEEIAKYLSDEPSQKHLWRDLFDLQKQLQRLMADAYEYEGNSYAEDAAYYARYFEMRLNQCRILHNLQNEMQKIKNMPVQAAVIVEYIRYMNQYVTELNEPTLQLERLNEIFQAMKDEPLPVSRAEFESRAVLYHILMDLEEFLLEKESFIQSREKVGV